MHLHLPPHWKGFRGNNTHGAEQSSPTITTPSLEHLLQRLPKALLKKVSLFSGIQPGWFSRFVSFFHHRCACNQMMHNKCSFLHVEVHAFKLFKKVLRSAKASVKLFSINFLGGSSFSSSAVFFFFSFFFSFLSLLHLYISVSTTH